MNEYIQALATYKAIEPRVKNFPAVTGEGKYAVLDTNVLLDIFYWKNADSLKAYQTLAASGFQFLFSEETVFEFADVISRDVFALTDEAQLRLIEALFSQLKKGSATLASPVKCKDKDDQKFLDLTQSYPEAILVTRDKKVLKTKNRMRRLGHAVMTPEETVDLFSNENCAHGQ